VKKFSKEKTKQKIDKNDIERLRRASMIIRIENQKQNIINTRQLFDLKKSLAKMQDIKAKEYFKMNVL